MWHNNYCFLPDSVFHWQHVGLLYYLVFYISLFIDPLYKLVQSERFFVLTRESVGRLHVGVFSAVWNFLSKVFQFADSFLSQTKGHLLFPFCSQKWQCHCFWRKEICYMVVDFSSFYKMRGENFSFCHHWLTFWCCLRHSCDKNCTLVAQIRLVCTADIYVQSLNVNELKTHVPHNACRTHIDLWTSVLQVVNQL